VIQHQLAIMKTQAFTQHNLLQSLADLLLLLLVSKSQPGGAAVSADIARIMLEVDLVHTLTEAIKSIDFNSPDAADAASALVKPLELLSRLASTLKYKEKEEDANLNTSMQINTTTDVDEIVDEIEIYHPSHAMETEEEEEEEEEEEDQNEDNEEDESEDDIPNLADAVAAENEEEEEEEEDEENEEEEEEEEEEESESSDEEAEDNTAPSFFSAEIPIPDLPGASIVFETRGGIDSIRDPLRLLQTLLPNIGLEDGPGSILGAAQRRALEGEVGRLLGVSAPGRNTLQRWTDDGQKATPNMVAYATSFEPYLVDRLSKITTEEREEKERLEKEQKLKEEAEKPKEVTSQPEPETKKMDIEPTPEPPAPVLPGPSTTTTEEVPTQPAVAPTEPVATPAPPASTDASIDPAFLEALPEELRAELLATQLGTSQPSSGVSTSTLNPDFLAALPPDIQAEVLAQENADRERQRRATEQPVADPSRAQEMDNASFLATLPPDLREEILMTSDDSFIATLPPQLAAEAHTLQERAYRGFRGGSGFRFGGSPFESAPLSALPRGTAAEAPKIAATHADPKGKPALEEESLVTLVKILYMQQPLARGLLQKILLNACYYDISRSQLLRVLMAVLCAYLKRKTNVVSEWFPWALLNY
jgi:hypothetical protein